METHYCKIMKKYLSFARASMPKRSLPVNDDGWLKNTQHFRFSVTTRNNREKEKHTVLAVIVEGWAKARAHQLAGTPFKDTPVPKIYLVERINQNRIMPNSTGMGSRSMGTQALPILR